MRIALVGLRGCGKTSIGRALASLLDLRFRDSDREVEQRTGLTPALFIEQHGLEAFRRAEADCVEVLVGGTGILALGGGALTTLSNVEALQGWVGVHLDAPDRLLAARLSSDNQSGNAQQQRPPLTQASSLIEEIALLRKQRWAGYQNFATLSVDTSDGDCLQAAKQIFAQLNP